MVLTEIMRNTLIFINFFYKIIIKFLKKVTTFGKTSQKIPLKMKLF